MRLLKQSLILALPLLFQCSCGLFQSNQGKSLHPAQSGAKYGYMDRSGKMLIPPQFDAAGSFSNGLAPVRVGAKWGYIDTKGVLAINPQFDLADPFSQDGLAVVGIGGKLGFIGKNGQFAVNPMYEGAGEFGDGLAPVAVN